jgi:hypothetical protein
MRTPRDGAQQLVEEPLPLVPTLGSVRAGDAVGQFQHSDHGNGDFVVAGLEDNGLERLPGVLALPLGGDGRGGIQH